MSRDDRTAPAPVRSRARLVLAGLVAVALSGCSGGSRSGGLGPPNNPPPPPPPAGAVQLQQVFPMLALNQPLALLQSPGDATRWYVVEKQGLVRVFDNAADVASSAVWLDIRTQVSATGEGGLLGLAFHPQFEANGELFVSYTAGSPFRSIVSRMTIDAASGAPDPGTEEIILEVPQPATHHNGGNLLFGPDGRLYVGFGDGGGTGDPGENGQNTNNLLGTILRIDVDGGSPYAIPGDNPFAGNTECLGGSGTMPCPEIHAWGLRNPWRFSFDPDTGVLWIGDVGQNAWEEIDRSTGGENFGWDEREGAHCYEPPTGCSTNNVDPVAEYGRSVGQSVTGGYVYRGSDWPTLEGQYLFGDFVSGRIWRVPADAPMGTAPVELVDSVAAISSFGVANDGELYVVDFGGRLFRVTVP